MMTYIQSPLTRALHKNGLNYLLFDTEDTVAKHKIQGSLETPEQSSQVSQIQGSQGSQQQVSQSWGIPTSQQMPSNNSAQRKALDHASTQNQTPTQRAPSTDDTQASKFIPNTMNLQRPVLKLSAWPKQWQIIQQKCHLSPQKAGISQAQRILWTYAGLEHDLLGIAEPARQNVIRRLITELKHPHGTHFFLPYSLAHDDKISRLEQINDSTLFESGMSILTPRVLLVFGSEARDSLEISNNLRPLQQIRQGSLLILQMHKPETLAENDAYFQQTLAFLRQYLQFCQRN